MARSDSSRRLLGVGARYAPRAVASIIALFSLLLGHQLIWTAFSDITLLVAAPQVWLTTDLAGATAPSSIRDKRAPSIITDKDKVSVDVVAPPGAQLELLHNGTSVYRDTYSLGRFDTEVSLVRGRNLIAVAARSEETEALETTGPLTIEYRPQVASAATILAARPYDAGKSIELLGFGQPTTPDESRVYGVSAGAPGTTDQLGTFRLFLPVPENAPLMVDVWSGETGSVSQTGAGMTTVAVPVNLAESGFQFVDVQRRVRRQMSLHAGAEQVTIQASVDLPPDVLERLSSRWFMGGEFLREVIGLCVLYNYPLRLERLGSLVCNSVPEHPEPLDARPAINPDGHVDVRIEVPRALGQLTINFFPSSILSSTFLSLPEDQLRVEYDPAIDVVRMNGFSRRESPGVVVWNSRPNATEERLFSDVGTVLVTGAKRPTTASGDVGASTENGPSQQDQPQRARLIERLRVLERLVPRNIRNIFTTLLTAIPFLYFLWILQTFPTGPRAHAATLRAVTLTFLMLHLTILAVSIFQVSALGTLSLLGTVVEELAPRTTWSSAARVLQRTWIIYPFLAIGIVLLVRPVFLALRRGALASTRRPRRGPRALGWLVFWLAIVGIPIVIVVAMTRVNFGFEGVENRLTPLAVVAATGLFALWFVLFWLFRGILRIGLGVRYAIQASWTMLLLPVVPLFADGGNAILRGLVATRGHVYPLVFPERASPYVATAIVSLLGAILLRQTGELAVRLGQYHPAYKWWRAHRTWILLVALIISIPVTTGATDQTVFGFTEFLRVMDALLPYALVIGAAILLRLHNRDDRFEVNPALVHVGALLFAWYVTSGSASLLFVPVPFLTAWLLFRKWLIAPQPASLMTKELLAAFLEDRRASSRVESLQKGLDKKLADGEINLADYKARLTEGETATASTAAALSTATGGTEARVLGTGPEDSPSQNAKVAVSYGLVISAPFQVVTLASRLNSGLGSGGFPLLELSYGVVYSVLTWGVMAGVFGYFYHAIRGRSGFEKALCFSLCAVLPGIPLRIVDQSLLDSGQILDIIQVLAFTLVLALIAFDLRTLQKHRYGWRDLLSAYGLASAAYGSTIVIAIGSALGGKDVLMSIYTWLTQ